MKYTKEQLESKKRIDDFLQYRKYQAENLLELVRNHKDTCSGEKCNVSLYALKDAYEFYKGASITKNELKLFL